MMSNESISSSRGEFEEMVICIKTLWSTDARDYDVVEQFTAVVMIA